MRKVLSLVLVLALVLGSFSMAFAATPADVVGTPSETPVSVLTDLGVVSGYADGTFKPAGIVTRAEMAKLIVAALGLSDYATGTTTTYSDMAGAAWAQGYVSYATGLGVVSGYPDGTFKPSQTVTYAEAAAMIVRALGYTEKSLLPATWPANFVVKAKSLGIFDDVASTTGGANRGDVAQMLYNALSAPIGTVNVDSEWNANDPADNMLDRLGAEFVDAATTEGGIIFGDEYTVINLRPFVGVYADRYLNSDGDIIMVLPVSTALTGEYDNVANIFTADDVDYKLASTVSDTADVDYFLNGDQQLDSDLANEDGDTVTIAVDLSGKTIKELYSIAEWASDEEFLFDSDYADEIADDQTLAADDFLLDDNDDIDLNSFVLLGAKDLASISEDDVVYTYDGDYIRKIEVGTEVVTGKITKVSGDDYTIGGKVYNTAKYAIGDTLAIGDTGTAKLDYAGDIFDWTIEDTTAGNYAIVLAEEAGGTLDDDRIKLLTKDGTETVFDVDSDAYASGWDIEDFDKGELVVYSTDKDGMIDELTYLAVASETAGKLSLSGAVFDGKAVDSEVVVFTSTSLGGMSTASFDVVKLADVTRDAMATTLYYTPAGAKIEVLIVDAEEATAADSMYAVINTTSAALNADGDVVLYYEGFADGKAFAAYTDGSSDAVVGAWSDTPTLYDVTLDADGVITKVEAVTTAVISGMFINSGAVVDKDGSLVLIDEATDVWYTIDSAAVFYELDATENEYLLKSLSSVKDGSVVTMWQVDEDSEVYDIVVIEN